MKNYLLILFLISSSLHSQNINELKKFALRDAKAVSNASIKKDATTIIKYTHPKIIQKYGQTEVKEIIEQVYKTMSAQKIKIVSSEIDEVSEIRKEKKEYRSLVKNTIKMDFNGRPITLKSSLFGFYDKKKQQWYFIESNKLLNDPETKKLFSDFKTEIKIPEDEQIANN
ncbi:hypothetical protein [Aquimarina sp. RZ0]|uniref:hypothetical protein n=1 Tax=Aquimarina sp. RZ0 TaxID=2607730 RepID=UPI0011F36B3B|nr:hypothetical protein [Aquimarina sp. RZ0]KAA1247350.1 hypothetical protein F0000_04180 [Aquimarina sp. RZ0]